MTEEKLQAWMSAYGRAWEDTDRDAFVALFADDASYAETPFASAAVGKAEISAYAGLMEQHQREVSFSYEILAVDPAVVHWSTAYTKVTNGEPTRLDGMFLLEFDEEGRCTSLREWWHADPGPAF